MNILTDYIRLSPWEEAVGCLTELVDKEGIILAKVGRETLCLPVNMEETLSPHMGKRIAIIRTDESYDSYRLRLL